MKKILFYIYNFILIFLVDSSLFATIGNAKCSLSAEGSEIVRVDDNNFKFNKGFSDEILELLIECSIEDKYFIVEYPPLDSIEVEVYQKNTELLIDRFNLGDAHSGPQSYHRPFIKIDPHNAYKVKISTKGPLKSTLSFKDKQKFSYEKNFESLTLGLFYGLVAALVFYNLFLLFFSKEKSYLYYVGYLSFFALYQLCINGFVPRYFSIPYLSANDVCVIALAMFYSFLCFFSSAFLGREYIGKKLYNAITGLSYFYLSLVPLHLISGYNITTKLIALLTFPTLIIVLMAAIRSLLGKNKSSIFFLCGWTFFLISVVVASFNNLGLIADSFWVNYSIK